MNGRSPTHHGSPNRPPSADQLATLPRVSAPENDPAPDKRRKPRDLRPPEAGWTLGAGGLSKGMWAGMSIIILALAVLLFWRGYMGYGAIVTVLAAAAAVNLT